MDLLTLHLNKPLSWTPVAGSPIGPGGANGPDGQASAAFGAALSRVAAAADGREAVLFIDWEASIDPSGDDGPHARSPLPSPIFVGEAAGMPAGGEAPAPGGEVAVPGEALAPGGTPVGRSVRLEPGRYAFVQARPEAGLDGPAAEAWFSELVEWFAREAWWTGLAGRGPIVARLVREDGKTAVQLLRAVLSTPS